MPLGWPPTAMVFTCFQPAAVFATTETLPWLATLVRGSVFAGVPEVLCCGSSLPGGSPPQLLTYTFSPTTSGMYGATPTGTRAWTPAMLRSCSSLPRDAQTQRYASPWKAMPVGYAAPPTAGAFRTKAASQP